MNSYSDNSAGIDFRSLFAFLPIFWSINVAAQVDSLEASCVYLSFEVIFQSACKTIQNLKQIFPVFTSPTTVFSKAQFADLSF